MLFIVRLLVAAAISGQWVIPAVCMDNDVQIINSPDKDPAVISTSDKKTVEKINQEALPSAVVSSKVIPRSAIDIKELAKIFNIAYSSNESRVLSQPLNHYELPDEESVKRDFRNVKMDNAAPESQVNEFSPVPWVTEDTLNAAKDETITNVHVVEKPVHANDNLLSELMFQAGKITDALMGTIQISASSLKKQLETLGSKASEISDAVDMDFMIVFIIIGCLGLLMFSYIIYRVFLNLTQQREPFDCEEGKIPKTMRKVFLSIYLENDNIISHIDVHENEDELHVGNKKNGEVNCVYPSPGASINEIMQEALKM